MKETLILVGGIIITIGVVSFVTASLIILAKYNKAKRYCRCLVQEILTLKSSANGNSLCIHKYRELVEKSAKFGIFMVDIDVFDDELAKVALAVHRRHIAYLKTLLEERQRKGSNDQGLENEISRMFKEGEEFEKDFITSPKPPMR